MHKHDIIELMSSHENPQPVQPQELTLFDVQRTVSFGSTDPSATPHVHLTFSPTVQNEQSSNEVIQPTIHDAQEGVSVNVKERAKILGEFVLPLLAGIGKRQALKDAMFTDRSAVIVDQYGDDTNKRVQRAGDNAQDMERTLWNLLYKSMKYEDAAAAGVGNPVTVKRVVSDDVQRLKNQYGRGHAKENQAYRKVLKRQR